MLDLLRRTGRLRKQEQNHANTRRRHGEAVRLFTRRGYDWTDRYPAIASAAAKLRARSFTLDGEAVVCGADGVAIFDALHRHSREDRSSFIVNAAEVATRCRQNIAFRSNLRTAHRGIINSSTPAKKQ
jgi:hypothetical protein